ncbi:MAG: RraA family protein [Dongiaceae bacterium]
MTDTPLNDRELAALRALDTPTVCNALELLAPERRGFGFTIHPLVCVFPKLPPMVGYARTATIRATQPSARAKADQDRLMFDYYDYVAAGPGPRISMVQDLDGPEAGRGALWGEVNTAVHKALGCLGVVTNGSVRDIRMIAEGFQLLAGSVGPSHAFVHMVDFGGEVNVAGMVVRSGDLIHADEHGAVIVPHAVARRVAAAAEAVARREAVVLAACRDPAFNVDKLKRAVAAGQEMH